MAATPYPKVFSDKRVEMIDASLWVQFDLIHLR
jgi:hypothetical protein